MTMGNYKVIYWSIGQLISGYSTEEKNDPLFPANSNYWQLLREWCGLMSPSFFRDEILRDPNLVQIL